jgi:hypothetical protein
MVFVNRWFSSSTTARRRPSRVPKWYWIEPQLTLAFRAISFELAR